MMKNTSRQRLQLKISGLVQGVGFRPQVFRLATELGVMGWVRNSAEGVIIEIEGETERLSHFRDAVCARRPPNSYIETVESTYLNPIGHTTFEILPSLGGYKATSISPDLATCNDCLHDILTPGNRRYRYPFTNCTRCGPRYTIIKALPYDRPSTSMAHFHLCSHCQTEYEDPSNRRFHTQPNACPICGPQVEFWDAEGRLLASREDAWKQATHEVRRGEIIAVHGLGGFHLIADAQQETAVQRLRTYKRRPDKALALMFPSLEMIRAYCDISPLEAATLRSPEAPIVLLKKRTDTSADYPLSPSIAPGNPDWGIMLPYTPLHHLLLSELGFPVVATSGNQSDEPICIDPKQALDHLVGSAKFFLVHNRPILRPVDDSIVQILGEDVQVLRRARGYSPLFISPDVPVRAGLLGVGGQLKNTIALSLEHKILVSQHLGNLGTAATDSVFKQTIRDLQQLYEQPISAVACDLHPNYRSTQFAHELGVHVIPIQHHYAHILSCMAENRLIARIATEPVLGVAWDGTGYGDDGTIWGGEFLRVTETGYERVAHLRPFPLPGGEAAVVEPRRSALGLLYAGFGKEIFERTDLFPMRTFTPTELDIVAKMLDKKLNTPTSSSIGRLFDAIASLVGLRHHCSFEGQAAMELEFAANPNVTQEAYSFSIGEGTPWVIEWLPMLQEILVDLNQSLSLSTISSKFHNMLIRIVAEIASLNGYRTVVLTGGCFQNRYLTERTGQILASKHFLPYWHRHVPPNDAGISLGQILGAEKVLHASQHQLRT